MSKRNIVWIPLKITWCGNIKLNFTCVLSTTTISSKMMIMRTKHKTFCTSEVSLYVAPLRPLSLAYTWHKVKPLKITLETLYTFDYNRTEHSKTKQNKTKHINSIHSRVHISLRGTILHFKEKENIQQTKKNSLLVHVCVWYVLLLNVLLECSWEGDRCLFLSKIIYVDLISWEFCWSEPMCVCVQHTTKKVQC